MVEILIIAFLFFISLTMIGVAYLVCKWLELVHQTMMVMLDKMKNLADDTQYIADFLYENQLSEEKDYPRIFTQNPISDQDLEFIMHFMKKKN